MQHVRFHLLYQPARPSTAARALSAVRLQLRQATQLTPVTANISGTTYQGTVWLATVPFGTITSPVMGAELDLGEAMTPIALNYTSQAGSYSIQR